MRIRIAVSIVYQHQSGTAAVQAKRAGRDGSVASNEVSLANIEVYL
jgi:hypothetical protein